MSHRIVIRSVYFSNRELKQKLEAQLPKSGQAPPKAAPATKEPTFEIQNLPEGTRSLDPTILSAIISGGAVIIGSYVGGLINYLIAAHGKRKEAENAQITIKGGGKEISFPVNLPQDQLSQYIALAEKWDSVEEIRVQNHPENA